MLWLNKETTEGELMRAKILDGAGLVSIFTGAAIVGAYHYMVNDTGGISQSMDASVHAIWGALIALVLWKNISANEKTPVRQDVYLADQHRPEV